MKRSPLNPGKGFGPRATGLARKTELTPNSELSRSPMPRASAPGRAGRTTTPQQRARKLQLATWAEVRQVALERDDWTCVGCAKPAETVHHRAGKGAGGSKLLDVVENAISLCGLDNVTGCHGFAHRQKNTDAAARGLSVPRGGDYASWPVQWHDGTKWLLLPDGTKERVA